MKSLQKRSPAFSDLTGPTQTELKERTLAPPIRGHLLERLYRTLSIDDDWCVWHEDGFQWWPYRLPQRVRISEDRDVEGCTAVRAVVETDVAVEVPDTDKVHRVLDALNRNASLAGLARHADGRVTLSASMVVHPGNMEWAWIPYAQTAGLQPLEAARAASALTEAGAKPAQIPHPAIGEREVPDEMNHGALDIVWQRCLWSLDFEGAWERLSTSLRERGVYSLPSRDGLVAELPFGNRTALLQIISGTEHPTYKRGVLYLLRVPVGASIRDRVEFGPREVVTQLNRRASSLALRAASTHCLGAWVFDEDTDTVVQATFLPAGSCSAGVVEQMGFAIGAQAMELGRELGTTLVGDGPAQTALEAIGEAVIRRIEEERSA